MHLRYSLIVALIFIPQLISAQFRIDVKEQADFEQLGNMINDVIRRGEADIEVIISPGTYFYKDNHINLTGYNCPNTSISIESKQAKIVSSGKWYKNGDVFDGRFDENNAFITRNLTLIPIWTPVRRADGLAEVLDEKSKLCRVKCPSLRDMDEQECQFASIRIPHWFLMSSWGIKKIENGYVYFVVRDLHKMIGNGWYVNDDYNYGRVPNIRYSLSNVETDEKCLSIVGGKVHLPRDVREAYECSSKHFMVMKDCQFKNIKIEGLNVIGSSWYMTYLMDFDNVITHSIRMENCNFCCITGDVVSFKDTPNATIRNCGFKDCYRSGVVSNIGSLNTIIDGCKFERIGLAFENTSAVRCQGGDYHIVNNTFKDYGYSAVSLGYGRTRVDSQMVSGVTEYNTIVYTNDYKKKHKDEMLMDGGAIYLRTQNDKAIIRYNFINGHSGTKNNRGIFCDDGAYNIEIYGNIITHIANSYCIDSRRVGSVEIDGSRGSNVERSNVNNKIYDNIVDGRIRFAAREGDNNGCELGVNYFLINKEGEMPKNEYINLDADGKEVEILLNKNRGMKSYVFRSDLEELKKSPSWFFFRSYIKR